MDGFLRKHAVRLLGLAIALLALISPLSFHPQDPTLANLRFPKDGIGNWTGFPGAMIGGSAVEGFGWAALLLPLLIANVLAFSRNRPAWYRYTLHGLTFMLAAASATGMASDPPTLGLHGPGLLGWTAGQWMLATLGGWAGGIALAFAGGYSLLQVAYAPQFRRVISDARTLSRFGVKQLFARLVAKWRAVRPQTGWAWHEALLLPIYAMLFALGWLWEHGIQRPLIHPMSAAMQGWRERRYSVARVKGTPSAPIVQPSTFSPPEPQPRHRPLNVPVPDAFANWMDEPEPNVAMTTQPAPITPASAMPIAAPPVPPVPPPRFVAPPDPPAMQLLPAELPGAERGGDRVARWEEYLRRYKENLDLDWDERSWKRKRLDDLARDSDDNPSARPPEPPK